MDGLMPHLRRTFWNEAHARLRAPLPWPERRDAVRALVDACGFGMQLVSAPALPEGDATDIAPPQPLEQKGYRCFLKQWEVGEETGIHGHPNTMFVYVISATIESHGFQRSGEVLTPHRVDTFGPRDIMTGWADNNAYDNFIHQLRCVQPGWSLHMYSDSGHRGMRFAPAGDPTL